MIHIKRIKECLAACPMTYNLRMIELGCCETLRNKES